MKTNGMATNNKQRNSPKRAIIIIAASQHLVVSSRDYNE